MPFNLLGRGASSIVRKAIHLPTSRMLALKVISVAEKEKRKALLLEMKTLIDSPQYPGLVSFIGAFYSAESNQARLICPRHTRARRLPLRSASFSFSCSALAQTPPLVPAPDFNRAGVLRLRLAGGRAAARGPHPAARAGAGGRARAGGAGAAARGERGDDRMASLLKWTRIGFFSIYLNFYYALPAVAHHPPGHQAGQPFAQQGRRAQNYG